jgi:mRNA-degrading endonuclease RelE of RelBE toxin-antitoxin system
MKKSKITLKRVNVNKHDPALKEYQESFLRGLSKLPKNIQKNVKKQMKKSDNGDPELKKALESKPFLIDGFNKLISNWL